MLTVKGIIEAQYLKHEFYEFREKQYCKVSLLIVDMVVRLNYKGDFKKLEALKRGQTITTEVDLNYYKDMWTPFITNLQ